MAVDNLTTEGGPSKRYRMVYWGEIVGGWDTARDALEHYHRHYQNIRPIINRKAKKIRPFYQFFDDQQEIVLAALRRAAEVEEEVAMGRGLDARRFPTARGNGRMDRNQRRRQPHRGPS
jgi:hypothetical protein